MFKEGKSRRRAIAIETKLEILREKELGVESRDICQRYNIDRSILSRIISKRDKIEQFASEHNRGRGKQVRMRKFKKIEDELYEWLSKNKKNVRVTNNMLLQKGMELYIKSGLTENFNASPGWLQRFKMAYNIKGTRLNGSKIQEDETSQESYELSDVEKDESVNIADMPVESVISPNKATDENETAYYETVELIYVDAAGPIETVEEDPPEDMIEEIEEEEKEKENDREQDVIASLDTVIKYADSKRFPAKERAVLERIRARLLKEASDELKEAPNEPEKAPNKLSRRKRKSKANR